MSKSLTKEQVKTIVETAFAQDMIAIVNGKSSLGTFSEVIIPSYFYVSDSNTLYYNNDGKVESEGNHEFLLKNSNVYKKLYKKESEIKEEM